MISKITKKLTSKAFLSLFLVFAFLISPFATLKASAVSPWNWPVPGYSISSGFGYRSDGFHYGVDIAAPYGTPIKAIDSGVVVHSGAATGYGNAIVIKHDDGYHSIYGHMYSNQLYVSVGQRVYRGQTIAAVGSAGESSGNHLHLSVSSPSNGSNYWNKAGYIDPTSKLYTNALRVQLNGSDMRYPGLAINGVTHVHWEALSILNIPHVYKGNGVFEVDGRTVQGAIVDGMTWLPWGSLGVPGQVKAVSIDGGWNFIYYPKLKVQINGEDMAYPGYAVDGATYIQWGVLDILGLPYTYLGNAKFNIEGRIVQGIVIDGHSYLKWSDIAPGRLTPYKIDGGWNFVYSN
jgi:murein DD-endopeptidase MepM/ murein hydrolase activator NlpD